jgi:hypothetical protein
MIVFCLENFHLKCLSFSADLWILVDTDNGNCVILCGVENFYEIEIVHFNGEALFADTKEVISVSL